MDRPAPDSSPTTTDVESGQTLPSPRRAEGRAVGGANLRSGGKVGRFFLLDEVGAGGMGLVWAAYDPKLDRKVALKFVRALAADPSGVRLLREAQAIAKVSHPNVIAVHDVGSDGDQVYVAEEFVHGSDLAAWLRARSRRPEEIVGVFLQAAQGLAAAHAAGIVHRDFKPANVLVGEDGRVRVVDFGLACSAPAAAEGSEAVTPADAPRPSLSSSTLTATGAVIGTPMYMSPEQHAGQLADARSDQYSFCASLWEALYGEFPFAGQTLNELAWVKTRGAVRPPPKGAKVPGRLRDVLLQGLQPEAGRRHASMEALIQALARSARPRGLRLARAAVGVAVLVAGAVAAAGVVQQRRQLCGGAERKLVGVWDGTRREAVRAAFLATGAPYAPRMLESVQQGLDAYGRDLVAMHAEACQATRLRGEQSEEALDLRMGCLSQRLQEMRAAADLFEHADTQVVQKAAEIVAGLSAVSGCGDVAALKAPLAAPRDAATQRRVEAVRDELARAKVLEEAGKYAEGQPVAEAALARAGEFDYPPVRAEALLQLGSLQKRLRQDERAGRTLEEAFLAATGSRHDEIAAKAATLLVTHLGIELARAAEGHRWGRLAEAQLRHAGAHPVLEARLRVDLGSLLDVEGRSEEARAELVRALALQQQAGDAPPLEVAAAHDELGTVLGSQGKEEECAAELRLGLELREKVLGPDHPDVALSRNHLGLALQRQGRYEESLAELHRVLAIREKAFGPVHPEVAAIRNNLGNVLQALARLDEALAEHRRALAIREQAVGAEHPDVAASHNNIAVVLDDQGRYDEALAEYRRALAVWEKTEGSEHPDVASAHSNIGVSLMGLRRFEEALVELRKALAIREKRMGPEHPAVATVCNNIGATLAGLGRYDASLREYRRALAIWEKTFGPEHPNVALGCNNVGDALCQAGRCAEALPEHRRALAIHEKVLGASHPDTAHTLLGLGKASLGARQAREAVGPLQRALAILVAQQSSPENLMEVRFELARALWDAKGDRRQALEYARQARDAAAGRPEMKAELGEVEAWLGARR